MKILYIITKLDYGGAQTHVKQCSFFMKEKGNDVFVMSNSRDSFLKKELENKGIVFLNNKFLKNSLNPFLGFLTFLKIKKIVKEINPDIVSLHSSSAGFWGRLAIRNKVPTIFTAHGWGFTDGVGFLRKIIAIFGEKLVASFCSKIICVSENDKNLALKYNILPEYKLVVIHNGVEIKFDEKEIKSKINFNLNSEVIPIIFVGRMSHPKMQEQLILAFNLLSKNTKLKSEIVLIGNGEKKDLIHSLIKKLNLSNKVHSLGSLNRNEVLCVLKNIIENQNDKIGIFCLISEYEGLPRSILEAMSFGYAVIASDVGGVKELVSLENGFLIKRNDVEQLKDSLELLLNNPNKIKEFGNMSYRKIVNKFSLEKMLIKTKEVYESVLRNV